MSKQEEALDHIAYYITPFRTINGIKYVELEVVEHLRDTAKVALTKRSIKKKKK